MDLGLNHVVRKHSLPVEDTAHRLIAVPSDFDRPGGLLVITEEGVTFKRYGHDDKKALFPRRHDMDLTRGTFITCFTTMNINAENGMYFLLCSDNGDIFKVTLHHTG